ncbi:hypothetical protein KEM48_012298 [Puccinia striiformis f. sp. tritici PST-130]|nr:hypothetical protein KEM48_012298 [Puccinia striiformis f. sp. tritici PST-130]
MACGKLYKMNCMRGVISAFFPEQQAQDENLQHHPSWWKGSPRQENHPKSRPAIQQQPLEDRIEETETEETENFTGRVHSESYSANNLSAAFDSILSASKTATSLTPVTTTTTVENQSNQPTQTFLKAVKTATLSTLEEYRQSILDSLAKDDPNGRIYSKNVRQMKDILAYEKWRKKLENSSAPSLTPTKKSNLVTPIISHRKELDERPSISDTSIAKKLINQFWNLNDLVDGTVLVSYAGYPTLIDELLKLKNIKKLLLLKKNRNIVSCTTIDGRKNEVEEEGLLDDVPIEAWEKDHPSLFFICQLPHNKRSIQFLMQLISFIPNRNWLFQYGRVGMGFLGSGDVCQTMTRDQKEMKYTRITAAANCLTTIKTPGEKIHAELTEQDFFPHNLQLSGPSSTSSSSVLGIEEPKPTRPSKPTSSTSGAKKKRIYKSSREANPTAFVAALDLRPKADLILSSDEFQCLSFLQRVMFIHSAQSWVESISHAAAGAAILYDRLIKLDKQRDPDQPALAIPKSKTPRSFTDQDWVVLAKEFNRWPFRPRSFENDLELESDDGPGT